MLVRFPQIGATYSIQFYAGLGGKSYLAAANVIPLFPAMVSIEECGYIDQKWRGLSVYGESISCIMRGFSSKPFSGAMAGRRGRE